jgi:anti-anti-sigma factor
MLEDVLRIEFEGRLVYETSLKARELLQPYIDRLQPEGRCILVVSGLSKIDSTGFGVFIHFIRQVSTKKIRFAVAVDNPFIMELFKIAKFHLIMTVSPTEAEALKALGADAEHPLKPGDY